MNVSMPYRATSSFLHKIRRCNYVYIDAVSMPYRATSSFLRLISCVITLTHRGFNALSGYIIISTRHLKQR